jgi:hypothetical protein
LLDTFDEVLIISTTGQNPGWLLSIDKDKIELLNPIRVVGVMVCGQVEVSDDLRTFRRYFREGQSTG